MCASGKASRVCDYQRSNGFLSKAGNMLAWSPDGRELAFAGTLEPAACRRRTRSSSPASSIRDARRWRTTAERICMSSPLTAGSRGPLTSGNYDEHSIDWGGDGRELIFLSNHEREPDGKLNYDIFAVNIKNGAMRRLTDTPGVEMDPRVSPDGRSIAYTATKRDVTTIDSVAEDAHAWVIPIEGGTGRELNAALDRRTSEVEWSPDGKRVVYLAADHGSTKICTTTVDQQRRTSCEIGDGGSGGRPGGGGRRVARVFTLTTPEMAPELFKSAPEKREMRQISGINRDFSTNFALSKPENIAFRSFDGTQCRAWLYPALNARGPSPMILSIHGGPHGAFGFGFNPQFQLYAARGYAVLAINPRGSSGYGQEFSDGCVNDWGGGDYKDLMAGVDHVLATHARVSTGRGCTLRAPVTAGT